MELIKALEIYIKMGFCSAVRSLNLRTNTEIHREGTEKHRVT